MINQIKDRHCYQISETLMTDILQYLSNQRYREVHRLIGRCIEEIRKEEEAGISVEKGLSQQTS